MAEDGVEFSARTLDDAIAQAETRFGTSRNELAIEVITHGSRGVFGIGAENARIRVRPPGQPEAPPVQEAPAPAPVEQLPEPRTVVETLPAESLPEAPAAIEGPSHDDASPVGAETAPRDGANLPGEAREVLEALLHTMGFEAEVSVRSTENPIILAVTGRNLGVLIGRRGDNLSSLQFMVNLILSKNRRQWPRVVIDVENYRARREESLRSLADRIAYRVGRQGRPYTLEAMPASDRRVIHLTLRDREDIETYSIGEGISRRVVIAPVRGARGGDQLRYEGGRYEDRDYGDRRY